MLLKWMLQNVTGQSSLVKWLSASEVWLQKNASEANVSECWGSMSLVKWLSTSEVALQNIYIAPEKCKVSSCFRIKDRLQWSLGWVLLKIGTLEVFWRKNCLILEDFAVFNLNKGSVAFSQDYFNTYMWFQVSELN